MKRRVKWCVLALVMVLAAAALVSGCGEKEKKDQNTGKAREYSDPAKPVEVEAGQEFVIVLESNPSTGYEWEISGSPGENIKLAEKGFRPPDNTMPGAPGRQYWNFKAESPASSKVTFNYVRPWEKDVAPAKTEAFTINVK